MGYDAGGRLTSEHHVASKRLVRLRRRAGPLRQGHARAGRRRPTSRPWTSATTGCCPKSMEFGGVAAGRYEYTLGDRVLPTSEKLTVGGTTITRALAFDKDRMATKTGPFTITRQGPGRRGLEDRRRQALARVHVRRQRAPGRPHADRRRDRALLPEAHVQQRGPGRRARGARRRRGAGLAHLRLRRHRPAAVRQARRDRAREPHLRPRRQPGVRRRGLRRPGPPDHTRRRRATRGTRTASCSSAGRRHVRLLALGRAAEREGRRRTPTTVSGGAWPAPRARRRRPTSTAIRPTRGR